MYYSKKAYGFLLATYHNERLVDREVIDTFHNYKYKQSINNHIPEYKFGQTINKKKSTNWDRINMYRSELKGRRAYAELLISRFLEFNIRELLR